MTPTDHQLDTGAPVREVHAPRLKLVLVTLLLLGLGTGAYLGVRYWNDPLVAIAREQAANDQKLAQNKQEIQDTEARLAELHKTNTALTQTKADIEARRTNLVNAGLTDPRPIVPFTPAP